MKNNSKLFPDPKYTRFCIDDKFIYVLNGSFELYGQAFGNMMRFSSTFKDVAFPRDKLLYQNKYKFRMPKPGDIVRVTNNIDLISEVFVISVINAFNEFSLSFNRSVHLPEGGFQISYYDPALYNSETSLYNFDEGIYLNFNPENTKKKCKYGNYHYKISIKKIRSIRLKEV